MSVSFVVPFYNEEKNLYQVYKTIKKLVKKCKIGKYEIILVNDGSVDNSKKIALNIKKKDKNVKFFNHPRNRGMGEAIKSGLLVSTKKYVMWVMGDNEHPYYGLKPLFKEYEKYDIVIPYVKNPEARSLVRRIISAFYTLFLNIIFFKKMKYYDGCSLYKRKIIQKSVRKINNFSMTFVSEMLIRSLKFTKNFKIVGYYLNSHKKTGKSDALKISNVFFGIMKIIVYRLFGI